MVRTRQAGNVARLKEFLPLVRAARQHDLFQNPDLVFVIRVALVVRRLHHVGPAEQRPKPLLLAQVACAQHHETIAGLERPVRRVRMAVAVRPGMHAVAQVAGEMPGFTSFVPVIAMMPEVAWIT